MIVIFHVSLSKMNPLFDEKNNLKSIYHTFIFEDTFKKINLSFVRQNDKWIDW